MQQQTWSTVDFERMSWHDCHVHAFRVVEGEHGCGELILDIDYILEWRLEQGEYRFLIAPVDLCFHDASSLRVSLDWSSASAALGPFSLARVVRSTEQRPHYVANLWRLEANWPVGHIELQASGFTQVTTGAAVLSGRQCLTPRERSAA